MKNFKTQFISALMIGLSIVACTDDDDDSVNNTPTPITPVEQEVITTVNLIFTDTSDNSTTTFSFSDPDGDGGNQPTIDTIRLNMGQWYPVSIEFLDESDPNDVEFITEEIRTEAEEHFICFDPTSASSVSIVATDMYGNFSLGLTSDWRTLSMSNSAVKITLKHQPGVKDGTCAPGDTDVEVDFPLLIQ